MSHNVSSRKISCITLAGGEGKRVGGQDKGLVLYENKPLIKHVIDSIENQVDDIVISANRNYHSYAQYNHKIISDSSKHYRGPLAGIAACLPFCDHELVLVVACDMPRLPDDLVHRLTSNIQQKSICIATVNNYYQLAMIINKNTLTSIQQHLDNNKLKLITWVQSISHNTVSFDDLGDIFININKL